MLGLTGKKAIVTGAGGGIGTEICERLAAAGCDIALFDIDGTAIRQVASSLTSVNTSTHQVDIADYAAVGQAVSDARNRLQGLDILINNAGWDIAQPFMDTDPDFWDRVIDINIKGVQNVIRHIVPPMIRKGSGVIVNFSSGWGRSTSPEVAPYCATKWAIEGLTQALAQELPSGLAAIPLNPGVIHTQMLESCFGSGASHYEEASAWAERAVPFLLELGPEHNGQSLSVP